MASGDACTCVSCNAIFSKHSKIENRVMLGQIQQIWTCDFCNTENEVDFQEEEEKPKLDAINYMIEAAAQVQDNKMAGQDISVIFCLDISGSMCVS